MLAEMLGKILFGPVSHSEECITVAPATLLGLGGGAVVLHQQVMLQVVHDTEDQCAASPPAAIVLQ